MTRFGVWRKKNYFVLRAPVSSSWPLRGNTTKIIKIKEKSLWLLNCFEYISTRVKPFFCITLLCRQTHFRRMKAIYKREWWTASTKQRSWMKRYEKKRFFLHRWEEKLHGEIPAIANGSGKASDESEWSNWAETPGSERVRTSVGVLLAFLFYLSSFSCFFPYPTSHMSRSAGRCVGGWGRPCDGNGSAEVGGLKPGRKQRRRRKKNQHEETEATAGRRSALGTRHSAIKSEFASGTGPHCWLDRAGRTILCGGCFLFRAAVDFASVWAARVASMAGAEDGALITIRHWTDAMNWKVILLSALMCSSIVAGDVDDEVSDDDEVLGPNGQALTGKDKLRQIQINLYHHKNKTDHKKKKKKKNNLFVTYTTTTSTSTSFVSSTTEVTGICAKLVNVTGACRRRRGQWVDEPIVMSFDDNMDMLDSAFSPSKTYRLATHRFFLFLIYSEFNLTHSREQAIDREKHWPAFS